MSILPIVTPAGKGDALQFSPTELLIWKATQATTGAFDQFELTAHTWTNVAETASTMLLTFVPGGMKPFFEEAAPVMHADPLDLDALTAINARHATTVVGPPLLPGPGPAGHPAR